MQYVETQIKRNILTWFNDRVKEESGALIDAHEENNNKISRLVYIAPDGMFVSFDIKTPGTKQQIVILKSQLKFAEIVHNRGGMSFFIFSVDIFKHIISQFFVQKGGTVLLDSISLYTRSFIRNRIEIAELKGESTALLDWSDSEFFNLKL